jgi:hypothetical protein
MGSITKPAAAVTRAHATPELEFIAQVRPLATGARTEKLDQILDDLLGRQEPVGLGLATPAHLVEYEPFGLFEVERGSSGRHPGLGAA